MTSQWDEFGQLLDALNADGTERFKAQRRLIEMGEIVVEPLLDVMLSNNYRKTWAIAQVLGEIGDRRCLQGLVLALRSENPLLSSTAAKSLSKFQNQVDILPYLLEVFPSVDVITQQTITLTLQQFRDSRAVKPLMEQLRQAKSPVLRCAIIQTLGILGDSIAAPTIRTFANDPDHHVREWVIEALDQLQSSPTP